MTRPEMASWNLGLRFLLELAALAGWAVGGWSLTFGPLRLLAAIGLPVAMAVIWGLFNVPGDPSRSGAAPVVVDGRVRLVLELLVLTGGVAMLAAAGWWVAAAVLGGLLLLHYTMSLDRVSWLLRR